MSDELFNFLEPYKHNLSKRYVEARWLSSNFDDDVWSISTLQSTKVDWRVRLEDGQLLTTPHHRDLLSTFKSWLIAQTHIDITGGRPLALGTESNVIYRAIHVADYFLIRAEKFKLAERGMIALTQQEIRAAIANITSSASITNSIYCWSKRLSEFLRSKLADTVQDQPSTYEDAEVTPVSTAAPITNLSSSEIEIARIWLLENDFYKQSPTHGCLIPSASKLKNAIYQNTLGGINLRVPAPQELYMGDQRVRSTEFYRARVVSESDPRMDTARAYSYVSTLTPLALLSNQSLPAPAIDVDDLQRFVATLDLKKSGRFRSLPHTATLHALRGALEFGIRYGDALVDSYIKVAKAATRQGCTLAQFSRMAAFKTCLDPLVLDLGVTRWAVKNPRTIRDNQDYFNLLRSNVGLYDSLCVLIGAIQVVVGALTARRQNELAGLVTGNCLDESLSWLIFTNQKSGVGETREIIARPLPPIGARFVQMLERMQKSVAEISGAQISPHLFSLPHRNGAAGFEKLSAYAHGRGLDRFCDWVEMPLDSHGRRFYIRQHQLRRFFAMLFFYGGGFGGLDTLRWFLGHTDLRHVWHYITESTPGAAIKAVAAEFASYCVTHRTPEAKELSEEVARHFGTTDFALLDEKSLDDYMESLISDDRLVVEPQFLDDGATYRIAVLFKSER